MKKLLITGASGFLGWNTCQAAKAHWEVYGTYQSNDATINGVTMLKTDLTDYPALRSLFQELKPDAVIHTAAQARPQICHDNPDATYTINVTVPKNIAGLCADSAVPCVFTSTDFVFDGLNPPYAETSPVSPINHYGEQKVAAETGMLDRYPATAVCRMPLMFGYAATAPSFLQGFLNLLRSGKDLKLFTDEIRTVASGRDAAQGLLIALKRTQGILHLGGTEQLSRYQFGHLMVKALGLEDIVINGCRQADLQFNMPRPLDVSLDSSKAYALGYAPGTVLDELKALQNKV